MQNLQNHRRFSVPFHFVAVPITLAIVIGSFINLSDSTAENLYNSSLVCALSIVVLVALFFARMFALKAQDRAIRVEENFRHFILTKKTLDSRLTMAQMIALRFASDEEFPALAQKAADNKMSSGAIKKAIKNWRPDYFRV